MSDNNEKVTLENKFENLEKIINQMEANELLDNIEKAMLVINNAGELEEF